MDKIEVIKDPKQDIEFWLSALSNPNMEKDTIALLNKCLQGELYKYLNPIVKFKTEPFQPDITDKLHKTTILQLAQELEHVLTNDLIDEKLSVYEFINIFLYEYIIK